MTMEGGYPFGGPAAAAAAKLRENIFVGCVSKEMYKEHVVCIFLGCVFHFSCLSQPLLQSLLQSLWSRGYLEQ